MVVSRVSAEICVAELVAAARPGRRPWLGPIGVGVALRQPHPRGHLHLVGAGDRVLEVLALLDEAADADHRHRREHGEADREADPQPVGKRWAQAARLVGNMLARRWATRLQAAATAPLRRRRGIDRDGVEAWFALNVPSASPPLSFERIAGGHSNLTFRVSDAGGDRWALRRPPLGKRLGSAHDMSREHKVVAALGSTRVPVAPVVGLCQDESVTGAPFYVMEFVEGPVLRGLEEAEAFPDEADRRAIGERVADTLAAIHAVDPDAVGLGDLGRKEDYVARQLHRWQGQWEKSKTRELAGDRLPARAPLGPHPQAGPGDDRPRRLPPRQHDPHRRPARSPRWSTGSSARSATRSPTSAC